MKILHLIDSLDYSGSARQLQLLGPAQANGGTSVEICCLGPDTPWATALRESGIAIHTLGWTRWFDFGVLWNLREIINGNSPEVIHVWRVPALRALAVVAPNLLPRVVMSAPLPAQGKIAWWDRRLLQQVRCLAVAGVSDQERCVHQGVMEAALRVVPPAIEGDKTPRTQRTPTMRGDAPSILCVGNLEREEGVRLAIWAFDILHQRFPDAQLKLVGAGSQRPALLALAQGLQNAANVQFLGVQANVAQFLREAEVVWIPSQANCGRQIALEAMALGCAVIASDVPCLREIVRDGETGYLVPVADVVSFARRTYALHKDASLRERIGAAARQYVQQQFPLGAAVDRWRDVYRSVAA